MGGSGGAALEEGSPLDAVVFLGLIIAGFKILANRGVNLRDFAQNNRWLTIFVVYCLISILWSDFPLIAIKRWIKVLGHPIMALIILTEADPQAAVRRLMKRIGYVLIPFSILFIKYYPEYGRGFDQWTGEGFNCGVALNKNGLGCLSMVLGIFFFWNTLQALKIKDRKGRRAELILSLGLFGLNYWLLSQSSSATSLSSMLLGMATIFILGQKFIDKRHVGLYIVLAVVAVAIAEPIFGIYATVVKGLGRNLTLTDRTDVWRSVIQLQDNPIFGMGFESFWLGDRLAKLWAKFWWHPLQAHNGYLETYLNLGLIGIVLLVGQIIGTFQKAKLDLLKRFEFGRLRLGYLFAIIIYNYTEAAFVAVAFVWTVFFLIAIDYPKRKRVLQQQTRVDITNAPQAVPSAT